MKKLLISTLCVCLLLVTGCENPKLKNGEEALIELDKDLSISADSFYNTLKVNYGSSILMDEIDKPILNKEYKTDDTMKKTVEEQITYIKEQTGEQFESYISQYWGAKDEKELEEKLILNLKRGKLYEDYAKTLVTDKEIEKYYEEETVGDIRASHILIKVDATDDMSDQEKADAKDKAKKKAEKIIDQLVEGKSFADLAKKNSDDEASAKEGGDLDFFNKGDMTEDFEKAAFALKKGEFTKTPVFTTYGYHIIKKTDEREKPKLKDVKDKIIETLADEKLNADNSTVAYDALVKVRKKYKLKINDSDLKKEYDKQMKELKESNNTTSN